MLGGSIAEIMKIALESGVSTLLAPAGSASGLSFAALFCTNRRKPENLFCNLPPCLFQERVNETLFEVE
jgi:hypothetical protein